MTEQFLISGETPRSTEITAESPKNKIKTILTNIFATGFWNLVKDLQLTPCSSLQLHLRRLCTEESAIKVLDEFTRTCTSIDDNTITLPETIVQHLSLSNSVCSMKNLYSTLIGHLYVDSHPEV